MEKGVGIGEVIALHMALGGGGGGSSGGGVLYVTQDMTTTELSKNLGEIQDALDAGKTVVLKRESSGDGVSYYPLTRTLYYTEGPYYGACFYYWTSKAEITFSNTTSPTDPLVYEK